jgi:hypothetical protein
MVRKWHREKLGEKELEFIAVSIQQRDTARNDVGMRGRSLLICEWDHEYADLCLSPGTARVCDVQGAGTTNKK